ncbi:hypothetical protein ACTXT7_005285 [Hymenolepis weldensis]
MRQSQTTTRMEPMTVTEEQPTIGTPTCEENKKVMKLKSPQSFFLPISVLFTVDKVVIIDNQLFYQRSACLTNPPIYARLVLE